MSERWEEDDLSIYLVHNFSDVRHAIDVQVDGGAVIENNTIPADPFDWETGHNVVYNDSDNREIMEMHLIVNGKGRQQYSNRKIQLTGHRCIGYCLDPIDPETGVESTLRLWSDPLNWPDERLPEDGEDVEILKGWNMILDIAQTPKIKHMQLNGKLTFREDMDIHLQAHTILVRAGELHIGSEEAPF